MLPLWLEPMTFPLLSFRDPPYTTDKRVMLHMQRHPDVFRLHPTSGSHGCNNGHINATSFTPLKTTTNLTSPIHPHEPMCNHSDSLTLFDPFIMLTVTSAHCFLNQNHLPNWFYMVATIIASRKFPISSSCSVPLLLLLSSI
ncbi:hypothetical protein O181_128747 [Austropuccinia psidii MF-1]|uniref:Uncharacterized protein n=1 Tax=Austropuccinia psidii MF-1 TaxID=1389203 RepID=A0A9Q3KXX1_9BASI|nr:hypothetical protein [Austropuccinia psidii MF-1]